MDLYIKRTTNLIVRIALLVLTQIICAIYPDHVSQRDMFNIEVIKVQIKEVLPTIPIRLIPGRRQRLVPV
jgi:hypothetical protein